MKQYLKKHDLDLLENGLEFIESGIESYNSIKTSRLGFILVDDEENALESYNEKIIDNIKFKYAILNLSSGVELILKEKLKREHWSLLFEKIEKANMKSLESGDFISTNFYSLLDRLENIVGISFDSTYLKSLKKERNKIEHFKFIINKKNIDPIFKKSISSIVSFIVQELEPSKFEKKEKQRYLKVLSLLTEIYPKERDRIKNLNILYKQQYKNKIKVRCIHCFNHFLIIDKENYCLHCGLKPTNKEIVKARLDAPKVNLCKFCNSNMIISDNGKDYCLSCRKAQK